MNIFMYCKDERLDILKSCRALYKRANYTEKQYGIPNPAIVLSNMILMMGSDPITDYATWLAAGAAINHYIEKENIILNESPEVRVIITIWKHSSFADILRLNKESE